MISSPKVGKASLLSEVVNRLNFLTKRCRELESELADLKSGQTPRALTVEGVVEVEGVAEIGDEAEAADVQLQRWAQLGETSLTELLRKDASTDWTYVCTREGITGFSAQLPPPAEPSCDGLGGGDQPSAANPNPKERLDYCVKSECVLDLDPTLVADAYMNVAERHMWHTPCQDSRLVEEVWPNSMRIAIFTYRTELPVFPRGHCALIHRAPNLLPDGRTQLVITERSVMHPAMPASRHFIRMTVHPSGMLITPVQQDDRIVSHVKLISHFHLRGVVSPSLLQRVKANQMLEACCFNYLYQFCIYVRGPGETPDPTPPPTPRQDTSPLAAASDPDDGKKDSSEEHKAQPSEVVGTSSLVKGAQAQPARECPATDVGDMSSNDEVEATMPDTSIVCSV